MSKRRPCFDSRQRNLDLDYSQRVDRYIEHKQKILSSTLRPRPQPVESYEELCVVIAGVIRRAIKQTNLSREEIVDEINNYFGWTDEKGKKRLSIHMLNNYIAKPVQYPIPAYYLFPLIHITGAIEILQVFAEAEGAKIIDREEVTMLAVGKMDSLLSEVQRDRRELLKGRGWR